MRRRLAASLRDTACPLPHAWLEATGITEDEWRIHGAAIREHLASALETTCADGIAARLAHLNRMAPAFGSAPDEDAVLATVLRSARDLLGVGDCRIWLWDRDLRAPVVRVDRRGRTPIANLPDDLLAHFRRASDGHVVPLAAGGAAWPAPLQGDRAAILAPIGTGGDCSGIISAHYDLAHETPADDEPLLAALGALAASALATARLHAEERSQTDLLQRSMRQLARVLAGGIQHTESFVHTLLQVAEGLTHAEWVCASVPLGPVRGLTCVVSSPPPSRTWSADLDALMATAIARSQDPESPGRGRMGDLCDGGGADAYALAPIVVGDEQVGALIATRARAFTVTQADLLCTIAEQIGAGLHEARRADALHHLLIQVSDVSFASHELAATRDPGRIMGLAAASAHRTLGAPVVICGWLHDDGVLRVYDEGTVGLPDDVRAELHLTTRNAIIRRAVETRATVTDLIAHQRRRHPFPALAPLGIVSWACVPMAVRAEDEPGGMRVRGIMLVADTTPRSFSTRDLALLATYANLAALTMENALLERRISQQLRQLAVLYDVTRAVGSTLDLQEMLTAVVAGSARALNVPAAFVCLADATGTQTPAAGHGLDAEALAVLHVPDTDGVLGTARARAVLVANADLAGSGHSAPLRALARREGLVSSLTAPLVVHGDSLGTLTVAARETTVFTADQAHLLQTIAAETAVAVEHARAHADLRAQVYGLRTRLAAGADTVPRTLEIAEGVLRAELEASTDNAALARSRQRLAVLSLPYAMVEHGDPPRVDLRAALARLPARDGHTHIIGAGPKLAPDHAAALLLFADGWLASATGDATIGLAQSGRELHMSLDLPGTAGFQDHTANRAIVVFAARMVGGTYQETRDASRVRIHLRCPCGADTTG